MKRAIFAVIAGAALATGVSIAAAQQSSNTKINDGINGAPNYNTMAPAGAGTASKINDGINGAPNYNAMSTAGAPTPSKKAASKPSTTVHAHHKHHTHAHAS